MMRAPTLASIYAAELKFAQSRINTRDSLRRAQVAFRATLTRPATLAVVAGATGIFGFWLARQGRPRAKPSPDRRTVARRTVAPKTSAAGLALAFIARQAMQRVPSMLQQLWAARQTQSARDFADFSKTPVDYAASNALH